MSIYFISFKLNLFCLEPCPFFVETGFKMRPNEYPSFFFLPFFLIRREGVRVKPLVVIRLLICCVTHQRAVRDIGECSINVHKHVVYTVLVLLCSHTLVHRHT